MKPKDLIIAPCECKEIRLFVETNHYSHSINGVKISYCFSVKHNGELIGGVIYGAMSTTAWKKFGDNESDVLELRRLVLLDIAPKNSESYVVGSTLRWLKKNSVAKIIVSYADPKFGHSGVIYRASNFKLVGLSSSDVGYEDVDTGKIYHSRALRTKYKGKYKPFVVILRKKKEEGKLKEVKLPGKFCYVYRLCN